MVTFGIGLNHPRYRRDDMGPNDLQIPAILAAHPIMIGDLFIPGKTARASAIAVCIVVSLVLYLRYSRAGVALRAAAADAYNRVIHGHRRAADHILHMGAGSGDGLHQRRADGQHRYPDTPSRRRRAQRARRDHSGRNELDRRSADLRASSSAGSRLSPA